MANFDNGWWHALGRAARAIGRGRGALDSKNILCSAVLFAGVALPVVAQQVVWPSLPRTEFIVGRAATPEDVAAGHAAFAAYKDGKSIGKPIPITIPQYAWYKDGSAKLGVVVIQAEEANGMQIYGALRGDGKFIAGLSSNFELIGETPPR